ncbi:class IV adenylate cyclase [candidate division KSB1 bacterium]|nr:class IV adenylate cyclase [candidate division KSB1 bacterium]MBL7095094.1 class IV adenylate cyclase [candidate division KSB1 bacterium]
MSFLNIEIKARTNNPDKIRKILQEHDAAFKGLDNQIDTYFNCKNGRLKLREGNVENHLIHYNRENKSGAKDSIVTLYRPNPDSSLKDVLINGLGILVVVEKAREIYFLNNVKFHIDSVEKLGSFIEIEAIDEAGDIGREKLTEQCGKYVTLFKIQNNDLIDCSYSDMLMEAVKREK